MSRYVMPLAAVLVLCLVVPTMAAEPQLAHMVYFKLKDSSDASKEKLVAACQEYLSDHEGTVYFSAGVIAKDLDREVNDKDFDVALHLVFRDKAAHDKYSTHERHVKFIEKCQEGWAKVRVFDSYIGKSK
ncbi:MAG: Dabb family protein [Pirellulaceae bacterium]